MAELSEEDIIKANKVFDDIWDTGSIVFFHSVCDTYTIQVEITPSLDRSMVSMTYDKKDGCFTRYIQWDRKYGVSSNEKRGVLLNEGRPVTVY